MASREPEIRAVAAELDRLLDDLDENVRAMADLLTRTDPPPDDERTERLVTPS